MPTIKLRLDTKSLNEAIKELGEYREKLEKYPKNAVRVATEEGVQQARELAMYMNAYDSGELVNGIVAEYGADDTGRIHSTAPHTAFVELGTGVAGSQNPAPENYYPGWQYDVNEHGEAGWWYIGKDGKRHWTKGMPSRPFLYETARLLKEARPFLAERALKEGR